MSFAWNNPGVLVQVGLSDSSEYSLSPRELDGIAKSACAKRFREFRAGRFAARQAIERLGYDAEGGIGVGANRAPIWPSGICGSISHAGTIAVAAVAKKDQLQSLGIDIELVTRSVRSGFEIRVAHDREIHLIRVGQISLIELFAAKEAIYKAFSPLWKKPFGFHSVELSIRESEGVRFVSGAFSEPKMRLFFKDDFFVTLEQSGDYVLASVCLWS